MAPCLRREGKAGEQKVKPVSSVESEDKFDCSPECERGPAVNGNDVRIRTGVRASTLDLKNKPNRWDLDATLELLDSMKAYIIKHEVPSIGLKTDRWMEIAKSLETPLGMEPNDFARSCRTRYESVRRYLNRPSLRPVKESIRGSMEEYGQLKHRYSEIERIRLESRRKIVDLLKIRYVLSDVAFQASQKKAQGTGISKRIPTSKLRCTNIAGATSTWRKSPAVAIGLRSTRRVTTGKKSFELRSWMSRSCTGVSYESFARESTKCSGSEGELES